MNCETCGHPVPDTTGKRGRPAMYCSDPCRKIANLFSWIEDLVLVLVKTITPEYKKKLRGRIWAMANLLNGK